MRKFRFYLNVDKETEWLNEMSRRGYAMTGFAAGFYNFDICQPGEYVYQIDFSEGLFKVSNDYREFMREAGVEVVCLWGTWVFLRRKAAEGEFVLYTDVESSIKYYDKIKKMFKAVLMIECICLFVELLAVINGIGLAIICGFLIIAMITGIIRELMHVNILLDELNGRIGQAVEKRRKVSILIPFGMLMNAMGIAIPVWNVNSYGFLYGALKGFCFGIAIILLVSGLIITLRQRES